MFMNAVVVLLCHVVASILEPMAMDDDITAAADTAVSSSTSRPTAAAAAGSDAGEDEEESGLGQPFLELVTVDVPRPVTRSRQQRHVTTQTPVSAPGACSVQSKYVSFAGKLDIAHSSQH